MNLLDTRRLAWAGGILLVALWSASAVAQRPVPPPATLVICPAEFDEALAPWIDFRQSQGYVILVRRPTPNSYGLNKLIRETAKAQRLNHVVIIGDAVNERAPENAVPTDYVRATVNVQFGSEPEIATDQSFADFNDDGLPDIPVGRICADTADQLHAVVNKILEYERNQDFGTWRRRIDVVAGTGGFGPVIDKIIESTAKHMITNLIPAEYETTMTYGSWTSPYCPDPRRFSQTAVDSLNRGGLFWVYIGHGHPLRLDRMRVPGGEFPIFEQQDFAELNCAASQPIGLMLSCYTGAFDFQKDCLAENLVNSPHGPVAVICGTRVTMPYAMSLLSLEMMQDYFESDRSTTLGQLVHRAKRRLVHPENRHEYRKMIEALGRAFSPTRELLGDELQEHVYLFHILGDPLLTMHRPQNIELMVERNSSSGQQLAVRGTSPVDGELTVELVYRRDRLRIRPKRRQEFELDPHKLNEYQATYAEANNRVCCTTQTSVIDGEIELRLQIPPEASGECIVRAHVAGSDAYAMGQAPVFVKKVRR